MLLTNAAFIFAMLLLFAACGWWAVAPLRQYMRFPVAVAVLAGMALLSTTSLIIQVGSTWSFSSALYMAAPLLVAGSAISVVTFGYKEVVRDGPVVLVIALVAALAVTVLLTRAEIRNGEPSLVYIGGTDHLGYAHVADWLRVYGANTGLDIPPEVGAYASWPDLALKSDPRFGTFSFVALLSVITGRSGAFTYDLASAIALAAAAVGLAGLFSRRLWSLALCTAALLVSPLYEFSLLGHLGKVNGFPSALLATGMYFNLARADLDDDVHNYAMLAGAAAITAASALMFSGYVTALALACFGGSYLLLQLFEDRHEGWQNLRIYVRPAAALASLLVLAVLAYGVASRPLYIGYATIDTPWRDLWYTATGVQGLFRGISDLPTALTAPVAVLLPLLALAVGAVSLRVKRPESGALVLGVAVFVALLFVTDDRWRFYQTIPLYITALLCAAAALGGTLTFRGRAMPAHALGGALLALCLAVGGYRAKPISEMLGGGPDTQEAFVYMASEVDGLTSKIVTAGPTTVDVGPTPHPNILLLVELGGAGAPFQLTETSWNAVLAYRIWKYPGEKPGYPLRLVIRSEANTGRPTLIYRTRQFDLLRPDPASPQQ
jgi:hypothetical protein